MPVPRLSKTINRENEASRPKNRGRVRFLRHQLDVRDEPGHENEVHGPSPMTWYAMLQSPLFV